MCGFQWGQGVRVLASKILTHAELQYLTPIAVMARRRELSLTCWIGVGGNNDTVLIDAPDYPSAMEALFRQWSPNRKKEIEA
jgi:hypothetical protein